MKSKVLVVDDSADMQALVEIHLRQDGVEAVHAYTAPEALSLVRTPGIAAILLDLELGKTSGLDVCRAVKEDTATMDIPVIILTATIDSPVKLKALALGAVDYVIKPFAGADLRARVRTAMRLKRYADLLREHASLDAETELFTRSAFDRSAGDAVLFAIADAPALIAQYGAPFHVTVLRAVADAVRGVAAPNQCFLHEASVVAVVSGDPAELERAEARVAALSFVHGGKPVRVDVRARRHQRGPLAVPASTARRRF